jgi:isocitrate dehydrogenase (NAD+)
VLPFGVRPKRPNPGYGEPMPGPITIVVLQGDQTGQELLDQAIRLLDRDLLGIDFELEPFDLSLECRRETSNGVVDEAAQAMREAGLGLKAATITPEGRDDVGSPNRILREAVDGKVIVRTGRRLPGVNPIAGVHHPISIVRMAVEDAYGAEERREGEQDSEGEVAFRTERITRSTCRAVAEYAFRTAEKMGARVYGGPKWTVSPTYEGMLKEEMDAAADRHQEVEYRPVLIDATYAGLLSGAADVPLVIPALNRDGDCLSDMVLPMFGSIAGAESVLLAFDENYDTTVAMAEAPHGTAPALEGKDLANPLAMILACGALLRHAAERHGPEADRASRAVYEAALETVASGTKTPDLGGHAGTTEFTDAVIERVRTKLEIWSSL